VSFDLSSQVVEQVNVPHFNLFSEGQNQQMSHMDGTIINTVLTIWGRKWTAGTVDDGS
jgi:hypothetical protein